MNVIRIGYKSKITVWSNISSCSECRTVLQHKILILMKPILIQLWDMVQSEHDKWRLTKSAVSVPWSIVYSISRAYMSILWQI